MLKLQEPKVTIICRKQDKNLVEQILKSSVEEYQKKTNLDCELNLDNEIFLPPGPETASKEGEFWFNIKLTKKKLLIF